MIGKRIDMKPLRLSTINAIKQTKAKVNTTAKMIPKTTPPFDPGLLGCVSSFKTKRLRL